MTKTVLDLLGRRLCITKANGLISTDGSATLLSVSDDDDRTRAPSAKAYSYATHADPTLFPVSRTTTPRAPRIPLSISSSVDLVFKERAPRDAVIVAPNREMDVIERYFQRYGKVFVLRSVRQKQRRTFRGHTMQLAAYCRLSMKDVRLSPFWRRWATSAGSSSATRFRTA